MLENISLDTEGFEEIFKKARSQISEVYPAWNNYNYHDPGITILELMAFLKEAKQFQLDHVSDEVLEAYLRLWGIQRAKAKAAKIEVVALQDEILLKGKKYFLKDICFETQEACHVIPNGIKDVPRFPFGEKPKVGSIFYLLLEQKLIQGQPYQLSMVFEKGKIKRNLIQQVEKFIPLARLSFSYWNGTDYRPLEVVDGTVGFLQDGTIRFSLEEEMQSVVIEGTDRYAIRVILEDHQYDVAPQIRMVSFASQQLVQKDSKAQFYPLEEKNRIDLEGKQLDYYQKEEEKYYLSNPELATHIAVYESDFYEKKVLAIGNGFPNQVYQINKGILHGGSFEILVESIWHNQEYFRFTQVESFGASTPSSFHYMVREETGEICFGDGFHGFCPETQIVIVGMAFTNCQEGTIHLGSVLDSNHNPNTSMKVERVIESGALPESLAMAMDRWNHQSVTRMVSAQDYEMIIKQTEGLKIADCKVLERMDSDDMVVCAVVQPGERQRYLSDIYKQNILSYVDDKRLLGTSLQLQSPTYTEIELFLEVEMKQEYLSKKDTIVKAIEAYFQRLESFGAVIEYSVLYREINLVEAVNEIKAFSIGARGDGILRSRNGDVITPPTSVTILKEIRCSVVS